MDVFDCVISNPCLIQYYQRALLVVDNQSIIVSVVGYLLTVTVAYENST